MMSRCPYLCSNKYSPSSPLTGIPHPPQDRGVGSLEQRRPHAYIENIHLRHEKGYYLSASRSPPISINKEEASYVLEPATHRAWCPVRHLSLLSKGRGTGHRYLFSTCGGEPNEEGFFLANLMQALAGKLGELGVWKKKSTIPTPSE